MEKPRRDNLRSVIGRARSRVEGSLKQQLVGYGLFTDAPPFNREELSLRADQEPHYQCVVDAVRREARAVGAAEPITPQAVARFVREVGGTWVNRLAALRALDARGLLDPAAALVAEEYGDMSPRALRIRERATADGRRLSRDDALRAGIEDACRELSESVRVLFDLGDEQSLIWPDPDALFEVLRWFSQDVTADDWAQPDVLGWVYQYYNTEANAELKRRKNSTTGFKYAPDDIPIANQFYTPHWVVRVLTDNTLGRLWLEMQDRLPQLERLEEVADGKTVIRYRLEERRSGVPHAAADPEAFKEWIAKDPDVLRDVTVQRLCRFLVPLPSRPVPRAKKSVRDIRVLDPACGSGHFLLYAFDILFAMYREAEPDLDPRAIPAVILEHNLYGIDIDLRAAQLAAFDLYLKARSTLAALDPKAPLDLKGLNIVVADAHIGDDPRKAAFLERYRDEPHIQQLYRKVLSDLDHTNALGSLLKVRSEFETLFGRIRQSRRTETEGTADGWVLPGQQELLDVGPQPQLRATHHSPSGRVWTLAQLLAELRQFEAEVFPSQDIGARLFYSDLERTTGLLALLSEQYDVVLMNPPYGDMPPQTKDYLKGNKQKRIPAHYPNTHGDLFAAFLEQAVDLAITNGFVGALVPRSFMYLSSFDPIREELLAAEAVPEFIQEYGLGILDGATVRTAGAVIRKVGEITTRLTPTHSATFNRLAYHSTALKPQRFTMSLPSFVASGPDPHLDWFIASLASLRNIPGMPYAYWASDSLRALFTHHPPLDRDHGGVIGPGRPDKKIAHVKQGLATADDSRFVRYWWEVPLDVIGQGRRWVPFLKGGVNVRFFARTDLVVNWDGGGREIYEYNKIPFGGAGAPIRNPQFYFRSGITWQYAGWRLSRFGAFGAGHIFGHGGRCVFRVAGNQEPLLAFLNSSLGNALMWAQMPERKWEQRPVSALPVPEHLALGCAAGEALHKIIDINSRVHVGDETFRHFTSPDLLSLYRSQSSTETTSSVDIPSLLAAWLNRHAGRVQEEAHLVTVLDEDIFRLYEVSAADRALVEWELAQRPNSEGGRMDRHEGNGAADACMDAPDPEAAAEEEVSDPDDDIAAADDIDDVLVTIPAIRTRDLVARWVSYYLRSLFQENEGITPVDAMHGIPALVIRLRAEIEKDLGDEAAHALEAQAPACLGVTDLAEWLAVSREEVLATDSKRDRAPLGFFPWHVLLYRNRPIVWLLSSENFERGRVSFTFRAYLHYLKLSADTLPRLLAYYVDPCLDWADCQSGLAREEASRLEGRARLTANAKVEEWINTVDALRGFRSALEKVIQGPPRAEQVPETAKWIRRTIAQVRGGQDIGHGYRPDIDFGVRVNIAPLVEQRLLPRVVLKRLGG